MSHKQGRPSFPPEDHPLEFKKGNDGLMYQSRPTSLGFYRWINTEPDLIKYKKTRKSKKSKRPGKSTKSGPSDPNRPKNSKKPTKKEEIKEEEEEILKINLNNHRPRSLQRSTKIDIQNKSHRRSHRSHNKRSYKSDCIKRSEVPLKDYQKKVVKFINKNESLLVVHSTGLGKTLSALVASQCYLDKNPENKVVVISPASVISNFEKEMVKYNKNGKLSDKYHFFSFEKFMNLDKNPNTQFDCSDSLFIIDEVHNLRNYESIRFSAAMNCAKSSNKILLLTATPFINDYDDLYSIINLLERKYVIGPVHIPKKYTKDPTLILPGLYKHISDRLYNPRGSENTKKIISELLKGRIHYETNKSTDDFPKIEIHKIEIKMTPKYYKQYISALEEEGIFGEFPASFYHGYRRAVNKVSTDYYSLKMDKCLEYIKNKQSVIYSNWLQYGIGPISDTLDKNNIKYEVISGSVDKYDRAGIVQRYNNKEIQVLVISEAGSEGIDLKETRSIVIVDPTWNPASIEQIIGRGVRFQSHKNLPEKDRKVDIYMLELVKPDGISGAITGDQVLYNIIENKKDKEQEMKKIFSDASI